MRRVELSDSSRPADWTDTTLGEAGEWFGGGTPSKQNPAYWEDGTIPWVSPKDMKVIELSDSLDHVTERAVQETAAKLVRADSVALVTRSGILQRTLPVALVPFAAAFNQDMRVVVPREGIDARWLLYALLGSAEGIRRSCQKDGTTVASIDTSRLMRYPLSVPPAAQQQLIVKVVERLFDELDVGVSQFRAALKGVERYRAACRAAAFDGTLVGSEPLHTRPLQDVASVQSGIAKGRPMATSLVAIPYIRTANVQAGYLDLTEIKVLRVTAEQAIKHQLQHNDVLVLEGGDADKVGRGWIWEGQIADCLHQNHVFAVRAHQDVLEPRYLAHYINAPQARAYFLASAKQTTNLASINKTQLKALPVPLAAVADQKRIVGRLDAQLGATEQYRQHLEKVIADVGTLRRSILHSAIAGRLATNGGGNGQISSPGGSS